MDLTQSAATRTFTAYVDQMIASDMLPPGSTVINAVVVVEAAYLDDDGVLHTQPFLMCPMGAVSRIWLRGLFARVREKMFWSGLR